MVKVKGLKDTGCPQKKFTLAFLLGGLKWPFFVDTLYNIFPGSEFRKSWTTGHWQYLSILIAEMIFSNAQLYSMSASSCLEILSLPPMLSGPLCWPLIGWHARSSGFWLVSTSPSFPTTIIKLNNPSLIAVISLTARASCSHYNDIRKQSGPEKKLNPREERNPFRYDMQCSGDSSSSNMKPEMSLIISLDR